MISDTNLVRETALDSAVRFHKGTIPSTLAAAKVIRDAELFLDFLLAKAPASEDN